MPRFVGIDAGAETVKLAEVAGENGTLQWTRRASREHQGDPTAAVREVLLAWDWPGVSSACATGRLGRRLALERIPPKRARAAGHTRLHGDGPATIVDLGAHGFSVLTHAADGLDRYRENPRCSQGTGNFLRQLVERFGVTVAEADALAVGAEAAPLSSRCPVILKTDVTHLANRGEARERILAGLFDAICANVLTFVKPGGPPEVWLCGGVSRSRRLRERFRVALAERGLVLRDGDGDDAQFLDAIGCALLAAERRTPVPALDALSLPADHATFASLPPLTAALPHVHRLPPSPLPGGDGAVLLGLDVGSTGCKAVALDLAAGTPAWEAYRETGADPVGAARALVSAFLAGECGKRKVLGAGVTGSGREIVGSMLATCFGPERVFVLNEIAAHAEGAVAHDPRVDTIFEIGGQDAKYIRLENGRVVDAAMNEACSAGTGSFIEEQGRRLGGLDAGALAREALAADGCVALGQHCSVFMAEIIDEAVAAGAPRSHVVAGLYDSVVQNYLNRVKGSRSVGQVVFCQGMPFSADALAAAVARQTGAEMVVPPNPGTVGAFGIALLARAALPLDLPPLDVARFLAAQVVERDAFVCRSTQGCGGAGNRCRIERLRTDVGGERRTFTWGGACALFDQGTRTSKLPAGAPDPFQARQDAAGALIAALGPPAPGARPGGARRCIPAQDALRLLRDVLPRAGTGRRGGALRWPRRAESAGSTSATSHSAPRCSRPTASPPICAGPMRSTCSSPWCGTCPRWPTSATPGSVPSCRARPTSWRRDLGVSLGDRLLAPAIRAGPGFLESDRFLEQIEALAGQVGIRDRAAVLRAHHQARDAQRGFDARLEAIGRDALERCRRDRLLAVVVLGRTYTLHDEVLNSNVPALLREQGAVAIPVDCFPVDAATPLVPGAFWSYTQRILRAAHHVRRSPGVLRDLHDQLRLRAGQLHAAPCGAAPRGQALRDRGDRRPRRPTLERRRASRPSCTACGRMCAPAAPACGRRRSRWPWGRGRWPTWPSAETTCWSLRWGPRPRRSRRPCAAPDSRSRCCPRPRPTPSAWAAGTRAARSACR